MNFDEEVTVRRIATTDDGEGGFVEAYADRPNSVDLSAKERVYIKFAGTGEREAGSQLSGVVTHVAFLHKKADVKRGDILTGSITVEADLKVLQVKRYERYAQAVCEEIQLGD